MIHNKRPRDNILRGGRPVDLTRRIVAQRDEHIVAQHRVRRGREVVLQLHLRTRGVRTPPLRTPALASAAPASFVRQRHLRPVVPLPATPLLCGDRSRRTADETSAPAVVVAGGPGRRAQLPQHCGVTLQRTYNTQGRLRWRISRTDHMRAGSPTSKGSVSPQCKRPTAGCR